MARGVKANLLKIYKKVVKFDKSLNVMQNGANNLYPEEADRFINNSVTAKTCSRLMASYLSGRGWGVDNDNIIVNKNDKLTLKYIGAYTDYLYTRITDNDLTGNIVLDEQFYAEQENENWQNEVQVFWDITDNWNVIFGLFEYHNEIDQDLDFWTDTGPGAGTQPDYQLSVTLSLIGM